MGNSYRWQVLLSVKYVKLLVFRVLIGFRVRRAFVKTCTDLAFLADKHKEIKKPSVFCRRALNN